MFITSSSALLRDEGAAGSSSRSAGIAEVLSENNSVEVRSNNIDAHRSESELLCPSSSSSNSSSSNNSSSSSNFSRNSSGSSSGNHSRNNSSGSGSDINLTGHSKVSNNHNNINTNNNNNNINNNMKNKNSIGNNHNNTTNNINNNSNNSNNNNHNIANNNNNSGSSILNIKRNLNLSLSLNNNGKKFIGGIGSSIWRSATSSIVAHSTPSLSNDVIDITATNSSSSTSSSINSSSSPTSLGSSSLTTTSIMMSISGGGGGGGGASSSNRGYIDNGALSIAGTRAKQLLKSVYSGSGGGVIGVGIDVTNAAKHPIIKMDEEDSFDEELSVNI